MSLTPDMQARKEAILNSKRKPIPLGICAIHQQIATSQRCYGQRLVFVMSTTS